MLSVVIPCYNEEEVLEAFYARTVAALTPFGSDFELIFVNDGSRDRTGDILKALHSADPPVKVIELSRNFGKEIALTAGLDWAGGDAVVVIDADLQDPPELIPDLVAKWRDGFDVVYATRTAREGENFLKRATAACFYRIVRKLAQVDIPANTGDYRLMSRRAVDALLSLRERHRFMKGLFSWIGYRQVSVPYRREARHAGATKWNYWRLWNFAIEGITSFSIGPLKFASYFGGAVALLAFCYALFLVVRTLILGIDVPGYASIMVTILFFSGVQLITLGVIGEYLGRMFNETKQRPLYLIESVAGFDPVPHGPAGVARRNRC